MSEPRWTPGPLTVRKSRNGPVYYIEAPTKDGDGTWLVAEVTGQGVENEANAHLLGSSQDLYDFIARLCAIEGDDCLSNSYFKEAMSLLDKARGEVA